MAKMRYLYIDREPWRYSIGGCGIGIIDPRNGKRHNVRLRVLASVIGQHWYDSRDRNGSDRMALKPSTVREFIDIAYRGIGNAAEFMHDNTAYSFYVNVWSSLSETELKERVKQIDPAYEMKESRPCTVLPESHKEYRFFRETNSCGQRWKPLVAFPESVNLPQTE